MIRRLAILAVAASCLLVSTRAASVPTESDIPAVYEFIEYFYTGAELTPQSKQRVESRSLADVYAGSGYPKWLAAIEKLEARLSTGMLPRGNIFSVYHPYQLDEAVLIFNAFYFAPTLWDFLWTAHHYYPLVNEYQFNYAFAVAVIHRTETQGIALPEPFAVQPEYFFNSDVMVKIYHATFGFCNNAGPAEIAVNANYTYWYAGNVFDSDIQLTYFMEDIGLNTWYYFFNMRYPFWMSSEEYPDANLGHRGELYYYYHKMFLNRYNMERLSNGMDFVNIHDWNSPIFDGYYPQMTYSNGLHFPVRPPYSNIPAWKNKYINKLQHLESRVAGAADSGHVMLRNGTFLSIHTPEGLEILGNLVQGNNDSYNSHFYGSVDALGRYALGFSPEPHDWYQILPSALEHFSTSLRDPAFYRHYARIMSYFSSYKESLGSYPKAEIEFKPVTINRVTIPERLFTYFERVGTTVPNYQWPRKRMPTAGFTVFQQRLNYHPFTYHFDVNSTEDVTVSVRIFLGTKYDVFGKNISDKYKNFYEVDYFTAPLVPGNNVFERKSGETPWVGPDYTWRQAPRTVLNDADKLAYDKELYGYPARMLLPRGKPEGLPFEFFFYITKFTEHEHPSHSSFFSPRDDKPFGFPLDRPIFDFSSPNMYFVHTSIYHKDEPAINLTTS